MQKFSLHSGHGYSLPTANGADARALLDTLKIPGDIADFQASLDLGELKKRTIESVVFIVGSGMNNTFDGMSVPSAARAKKALELHTKSTLFIPTARFTYRLLHQFNGGQPEPTSTDARQMARFLIDSGVSPGSVISEEWSNCTFGNAVFSRLLTDAFLSPEVRLSVVTSSWALKRAEIVFRLLFSGRKLDFIEATGDLGALHEAQRRAQEHIINEVLYMPSIKHYGLDQGDPLIQGLRYLRDINVSTPGNVPDQFVRAVSTAIEGAKINTDASYGVKKKAD